MRLMAVDYGTKRVGIASTDDTGEFALPRAVWPNDKDLLNKILEFAKKEGVKRVILGESKDLSGEPNPIFEEIDTFKKMIEEAGLETDYHPEALTTVEARQVQGNTDMTDASAAALILKSYIDSQK